MNDVIHSRCPVVRAEDMELYVQINVAGDWRVESQRRRILWLRESHTAYTVEHRGRHIRDRGTFTDFYGFLTSLDASRGDAARIIEDCQIMPGDALALVGTITISDTPVQPDDSPDGRRHNAKYADRTQYRTQYRTIGDSWFVTAEPDKMGSWPRLCPVVVARRSCQWPWPPDIAEWIAAEKAVAAELAAKASAEDRA